MPLFREVAAAGAGAAAGEAAGEAAGAAAGAVSEARVHGRRPESPFVRSTSTSPNGGTGTGFSSEFPFSCLARAARAA
eukprot:6173287-Pleurochrysis_carterae.AAC.1